MTQKQESPAGQGGASNHLNLAGRSYDEDSGGALRDQAIRFLISRYGVPQARAGAVAELAQIGGGAK